MKITLCRYFFLLLIFACAQRARADWLLPNTPFAALGDAGSLYLPTQGWTYHLNNNDWIGLTDKLMTGSTGLQLYLEPEDAPDIGYEFTVYGRLLTPIVQTRFDQPRLQPPPGVYADDLEIRTAFSRLIDNFKFEMSLSADLYGHYNGDEIQRQVHTLIGSSTSQENYGQKFHSSYLSGAVGGGFFLAEDLLAMIYFRQAAVMTDIMARLSATHSFGEFQVGAQYEYAYQIYSNLYENSAIAPTRESWAISFKWHWYQLTYSYISRYLLYDKFGQYYIDPLIVSFEF